VTLEGQEGIYSHLSCVRRLTVMRIALRSGKEPSAGAGWWAPGSGSEAMTSRAQAVALPSAVSRHAGDLFSHQLFQQECCCSGPALRSCVQPRKVKTGSLFRGAFVLRGGRQNIDRRVICLVVVSAGRQSEPSSEDRAVGACYFIQAGHGRLFEDGDISAGAWGRALQAEGTACSEALRLDSVGLF